MFDQPCTSFGLVFRATSALYECSLDELRTRLLTSRADDNSATFTYVGMWSIDHKTTHAGDHMTQSGPAHGLEQLCDATSPLHLSFTTSLVFSVIASKALIRSSDTEPSQRHLLFVLPKFKVFNLRFDPSENDKHSISSVERRRPPSGKEVEWASTVLTRPIFSFHLS